MSRGQRRLRDLERSGVISGYHATLTAPPSGWASRSRSSSTCATVTASSSPHSTKGSWPSPR
ncbi:hypothetical protein AV521_31275 [Streptomyces sp. IMTB 2501]|nr:hypothetical protein AV521_31275 [Streptomyces sp. IMTB 2501]